MMRLLGALALLCWTTTVYAQAYGNQAVVKTFPANGGTYTLSTVGTQTAGEINGLGNFRRGVCVLKPTAFAGSGTARTDVFLQMSPDNGVTWMDYLHFVRQATFNTPVTSLVGFVAEVTPAYTGAGAINDANIATGLGEAAAANGGFGDRFRVRVTNAATTLTFTFSIACAMAS